MYINEREVRMARKLEELEKMVDRLVRALQDAGIAIPDEEEV